MNQFSSFIKEIQTKCHNRPAIIIRASKQPLTSRDLVTHNSLIKPKERHEFEKIKQKEKTEDLAASFPPSPNVLAAFFFSPPLSFFSFLFITFQMCYGSHHHDNSILIKANYYWDLWFSWLHQWTTTKNTLVAYGSSHKATFARRSSLTSKVALRDEILLFLNFFLIKINKFNILRYEIFCHATFLTFWFIISLILIVYATKYLAEHDFSNFYFFNLI